MNGAQRGDLTDVASWERAWRRSPLTAVRSSLQQNHDHLLRDFFAHAGTHALSVLEIGCAPGKKLRDMARLSPSNRYSGVDFAPKALADTERYLRSVGITPDLHLADVRTFVPPEQYDLVVSFGLIEHFDDARAILEHHVRLAKPGGTVGVQLPNYRHPALKRALSIYSPDTLATHNLEVMDLGVLEQLARDCGLVDIATGCYGGATMPVARVAPGLVGRGLRLAATAWNLAFRVLPTRLSPWQGFLWVRGRRPLSG